jgi:hypothetical protein
MRKGLKAPPTPHPPSSNNKMITSTSIIDPTSTNRGASHKNANTTKIQSQITGQKDRIKNTCTVSARMRQVVEQMLACDPEQYALAMQETTIFAFKTQQSELILSFLQEMRRENCQIYQNKEALLQLISEAYDKTQTLFFAI